MTRFKVLGLGVHWTGATFVTSFSDDADVALAAIAAACYLIWEMEGRVLGKKENRLWTP